MEVVGLRYCVRPSASVLKVCLGCTAGALPAFESDAKTFGTMAAAPFGSSLILPISYAYIALMGSEGLTEVCLQCLAAASQPCSACAH